MVKPYKASFHDQEYERVQQSDDHGDPLTAGHPAAFYFRLAKKLMWIGVGVATVLRTDLHLHVLNWRQELASEPTSYLLAASVALSLVIMVYLVGVVKRRHGPMALRRWRTFAPGAVQTLTGANVVSFFAALKTFWPIYGYQTVPIVIVLCWSWLNLLTFV